MKIISVLKAQSAVVSPGAPQRIGEHAVSKLRSLMLTPAAAVSLITLAAACGSYSSPAGTSGESAGATSAPAGAPGTSGAGGGATTGPVAGAPSTQGGATNGGASDMPNGGAAPIAGAGGSDVTGGAAPVAGAGGAGGGSASGGSAGGGSAGAPNTIALPCDVLKNGGNTCVAAHSTVRVIVPGYAGPLYQLCKGSAVAGPQSCKGTTQDVASNGGYADAASQDTFCSGASCTITKIYDQSGQKNDLEPAPKGGAKGT
ncbi:MAG: arabinofuranosidase catalytic domain-containing protein, partial [Polyangiaceae bacterium]